MIRGFLFDLGGTLFDHRGHTDEDLFRLGCERSYTLLKESHGLRHSYPDYYRLVSRGFLRRWYWALLTGQEIAAPRLFRRLAPALGIPEARNLWETIERAWHAPAREHVRLIDGGEDLLASLKGRGVRLGVTSNTVWSGPLMHELLHHLGIHHFFHTFTFSSELGYRKPHRRIYLDALRKLGVPRPQVAFVGNQWREDVWGPERHGLRAIYFTRRETHLPFLTPRFQAGTLQEVKEISLGWCSS